MSALAVPKLRIRIRRRRIPPKPPFWWFYGALFALSLDAIAEHAVRLASGGGLDDALGVGANVLLSIAWRTAMRAVDPARTGTWDDRDSHRRFWSCWAGGAALTCSRAAL